MALYQVDLHGFHEPLSNHRISKTNKQSLRRTKWHTPAPTAALESVQTQAQHGGALTCPASPVPGPQRDAYEVVAEIPIAFPLGPFNQQQSG